MQFEFDISDGDGEDNRVQNYQYETQRNKELRVVNGFEFSFERLSRSGNGVSFWRCTRRNPPDNCKARIHYNGNELIRQINGHSHGADPAHLTITQVVHKGIKRRAIDTNEVNFNYYYIQFFRQLIRLYAKCLPFCS